MTGHIVFWGLCAVLVFLPLPIGSVEEWAVCVFEAATIGLPVSFITVITAPTARQPALLARAVPVGYDGPDLGSSDSSSSPTQAALQLPAMQH